MQPFDPRLARPRHAPKILAVCAALLLGVGVWQVSGQHPASAHAGVGDNSADALAMAYARAQPAQMAARALQIMIVPGDTLEAAVRRTGVDADQAHSVVGALASVMDTVNIQAGKTFQAMIAPAGSAGSAQLVGLTMRTGPDSSISLSRDLDGALQARKLQEQVSSQTTARCDTIDSSVNESAIDAGADSATARQLETLVGQKVDLAREIQPGDRLCLVVDRKVSASGNTVGDEILRYAELDAKGAVNRFYAFDKGDGSPLSYYDGTAQATRGLLLATPISHPRITSVFGQREHPILGYTRAHQGVDFGAPSGTPILAAGDGVIEQKRWASGYGNWLLIRHNGEWETGYGHISRYAPGIKPGVHVTQGQVVAYVGMTGLATGPHLHFEVWDNGKKINPIGARGVQQAGGGLSQAQMAAFNQQKAAVDKLLAGANAGVQLAAMKTSVKTN